MSRIVTGWLAGMVSMLMAADASAQPPPPTTPATQGIGVGPRLNTARPTPPSSVPANPSQRPPTIAPIPSAGPSVPPPAQVEARPRAPAVGNVPRQVLDEQGRLVPGAVQVSPTRAYDPASGRYFQTIPTPNPR